MTELNSGVIQSGPHVIPSGLRVYFAADRGGGNLDIFVASRADSSSPFGEPQLVAEVSSAARDDDVWVSGDERTMLFVSERSGTNAIYIATR